MKIEGKSTYDSCKSPGNRSSSLALRDRSIISKVQIFRLNNVISYGIHMYKT